ncbi:MAG: S-methyl-5-thioribose-1-phosphate isomerase, partial [Terriglobales bacterium]
MTPTVEWTEEGVRLLDQLQLPGTVAYRLCRNYREVADGIRDMVVRGAPAIGVTAAMGAALGVVQSPARSVAELRTEFAAIRATLAATRPTAVNLFWALERMQRALDAAAAGG